jgi:hypothetical protein
MAYKKKYAKTLYIFAAIMILITAVVLIFSHLLRFGYNRDVSAQEARLREHYLHTANQWMGANWNDGSHEPIIDLYNDHTPLAQGYTVKYTDKWCATFVSTVAIQTELTTIIPTECGCERQIELFRNMRRWEENDDYIPLPGDIIYYSGKGADNDENTGWSDHVGIVCGTLGNCIKVIEGNVSGSVAIRYVFVGDATIRGYGLPDYASILE